MVFTVLGGDNTGGIIWHPSVLAAASEYGMYLSKDNMLITQETGDPRPDPAALLTPLSEEYIAGLRDYSVEEMRQRAVTGDDRCWSAQGLLDSVLPGTRRRNCAGYRFRHFAGSGFRSRYREPARFFRRMAASRRGSRCGPPSLPGYSGHYGL